MLRVITLLALGLPLAGCLATGTKMEFAAMPETGPLTPTRLEMAKAMCKMRIDDKIDASFAHRQIVDINGVLQDSENCFRSQGIVVTGYRRKDGRLTASPWGS